MKISMQRGVAGGALRHWFVGKAVVVLSLVTAITFAGGKEAPNDAKGHSYAQYHESALLPYARPVNFQHSNRTLTVRAQINGGPVREFTVDTGSTGIVVGADDVPNIPANARPGTMLYTSSGVKLLGVWGMAVVNFPDVQGGTVTAVVPVLAVQKKVCTGHGVNAAFCHPNDHPHPYMMGVGFGRPEGTPELNPFLNLRQMTAGTMRRGYVIARNGITLGLTESTMGTGYVWQKLNPRSVPGKTSAPSTPTGVTLKDWVTTPGGFAVGGVGTFNGAVLMDTGLTNMILAAPSGPSSGDLPAGTRVTINLLRGKVHYSFRVGDRANPQTPRRVSWVKATRGVFVNTGLRALAGYNYLFDDDGGWLALRPVR